MPHLDLRAESVGFEHTELIPLCEITQRVIDGEIIVVPRCMQAIGYFEQLKQASLEGIRRVVGQEKAAQVEREGFEAIHSVIDADELIPITDCTYEIFGSIAPILVKKVVQEVLLRDRPFYYEAYPNVRFHVPYDVGVQKKQKFSEFLQRRGNGKITAHGPHHDSWYQCPSNGINIWIAIGPVKTGNGLSLYPQVYGKRLPCTKDGVIMRDQYFGPALNFELKPGDALVFHGEHLHSSELNSTGTTRHVVSFRITLEKPKFLNQSCHNYLYSGSSGGLMEGLVQLPAAKMFRSLVRLLQSRLNTKFLTLGRQSSPSQQGSETNSDVPMFQNTLVDFPKTIQAKSAEDKTKLIFDSSELTIGEIRPLSPEVCVARPEKHRVVAFSRYCPHEGADLAAGYLRDGCIACPWHNLPFDLENGASPCQSLRQLPVFDCLQRGDEVEVNLGA